MIAKILVIKKKFAYCDCKMFIHDEFFFGNCNLRILRMNFLPANYDYRNVHDEFCYFANYNCKNHPSEFLFFFTHCDYKMFIYDEFFFAKCPFMINIFHKLWLHQSSRWIQMHNTCGENHGCPN
jgi:hypothetical protein